MSAEAFIEYLRVCPMRPKGPLPRVSPQLIDTVREHGVIQPVVVRKVGNAYEILGNVETWMAAQQVGLERVPIHILEDVSDADAAEIVAASFSGYAANPIDEAEYLRTMVRANRVGRSEYKAVTRLSYTTGYARPYISHALRLLRLPAYVQELVRAGRLGAGHARALVTVPGKRRQRELADRIVRERLSVRAAEALATAARTGVETEASGPAEVSKGADVLRLERQVSELVGAPFEIRGGEAVFQFFDRYDLLEGLLNRLGYREA